MAVKSNVVAVIQIDKYTNWMVNEYNGQFSVVGCYKSRKTDEWVPEFCTVTNFKTQEDMKIPKGLGGRFDELSDLRAALFRLIKSIDEYDEGTPNVPDDDATDGGDDIPF